MAVVPVASCYMFGRMIGDTRQGWALLAAMTLIFLPLAATAIAVEQGGNPLFAAAGVDQGVTPLQPGGNMEGKEARFGIADSAVWATLTTAASNGSANSMYDSYTPTLPTHTIQFAFWLVGVIIIVGALGFLPALAVGPIAEHLLLSGGAAFK